MCHPAVPVPLQAPDSGDEDGDRPLNSDDELDWDIKRLIEDVIHNPDFNADDVDTDMLERFANSIDSGDLEIINMHQEGDGAQKLELFKRPAEKVLRELISDIRLAGCQHFAFKEYLDPHGNRLFAGHSNGSVSFQLAQLRIGEDKFPVSL